MEGSLERLRLLASAIAGRPLEVVATAPGAPAWTDGATVRLPVDATRGHQVQMVAVHASLVAAGSLEPDVLRALARRPALARRYLALEGHRALEATSSLLPGAVRGSIDHRLAARTTTPQRSLEIARGRAAIEDPPTWFGVLEPRRVLDAIDRHPAPRAEVATSETGSTAAGRLVDLDDDADGDGLADLLSSPVGRGGPIGRLLARLLAPARGRGEGGAPGADAPTHSARTCSGAARRGAVSALPGAAVEGPPPGEPVGTTYPEWDVRQGGYRSAWCTVVESDPPVPTRSVPALERSTAMRRPIARLGVGRTPTRRQRQGDDIDIDAAVEARVDHRAGIAHPGGLYVESLRRRRDLAILVLLDVSGSAGEPGPADRSVHEHQRRVAAQLVEAAHGLGDRVALYGFNSRGRTAVQLLRVKAFDDQLDGQALRRLGALTPAAYTRLGAAIRHGTAILEARGGTPRRLLVVLSDGFAYDHGYAGRYGEADARRALIEARRRGVGCLCLSVGTDAEPDALRRVFGPAAHATVPVPDQLPGLIGPLFRAALRSAEAQQRVHVRKERVRERLEVERRGDDRSGAAVLRPGR